MPPELRFPAYGEDLQFGRVWASGGAHGFADDFVVGEYDETTQKWRDKLPTEASTDDALIFGMPIRSATDGEVIAGWRDYPDQPLGVNPFTGNGHQATASGNHLLIRTDDGFLVLHAHLQRHSTPLELCPNVSTRNGFLSDPENKLGSFPVEYLIEPALRQRVKQGQFLGRVGHTGNVPGGSPHLHIQAAEFVEDDGAFVQGSLVPYEFKGALAADRLSGAIEFPLTQLPWQALVNTNLDGFFNDQGEGKIAVLPDESPRPTLATRKSDHLDLFSVDRNLALSHRIWNGTEWSDWADHGGVLTSAPAATSWASDRLDVFARGQNLHLWHKFWNGVNWSDWTDHGGILTSAPAVASWGPNRLDVFARGRNMHLWHKFWNGVNWSDWTDHGGILTSAPTVASWGPNRLDVFARGRNMHLWHKFWNGVNWSDWTDHGGILTTAPAVASMKPNRLDVFARGQNLHLWHTFWNGTEWSEWDDHDGVLTTAPAAASWSDNRIDVFARGQNMRLWQTFWNGATWSDWTDHGEPPAGI